MTGVGFCLGANHTRPEILWSCAIISGQTAFVKLEFLFLTLSCGKYGTQCKFVAFVVNLRKFEKFVQFRVRLRILEPETTKATLILLKVAFLRLFRLGTVGGAKLSTL